MGRFASLASIPPSSGSRLAGIEGLRALAATLVLVDHCWLYASPDARATQLGSLNRLVLPHLPVGVTLFFTLSGFLLYRPFAAAMIRGENRPSLLRYLRNRALRILPAYWAILFLASLVLQVAWVRESPSLEGIGSLAGHPFVLLQNALFIQNYHPGTLSTGLSPAWSLAVEVVFYITLPLLVLIAATLARRASTRQGRRLAALAPGGIVLFIGLSGRAADTLLIPGLPDTWSGTWHAVIDRSFWPQADLFTLGMMVAVLWVDCEDGLFRFSPRWRAAAVVTAVLASVPAGKLIGPSAYSHPAYYAYQMVTSLMCALLLCLVVLRSHERPGLARLVRFFESPLLMRVGVISYSVFLWHQPVIDWLRNHDLTARGTVGFVANLTSVVIITFLLSSVTYRFVEFPALRRKFPSSTRSIAHHEASSVPSNLKIAP